MFAFQASQSFSLALVLLVLATSVTGFVITSGPPLPQFTAPANEGNFGFDLKARLFGQLQPRDGTVACGTTSVIDCCQAQAGCNYFPIHLVKLLLIDGLFRGLSGTVFRDNIWNLLHRWRLYWMLRCRVSISLFVPTISIISY